MTKIKHGVSHVDSFANKAKWQHKPRTEFLMLVIHTLVN
jgi:hypothetical protein